VAFKEEPRKTIIVNPRAAKIGNMTVANPQVRHKGSHRYSISDSLDAAAQSFDGELGQMGPTPYRLIREGTLLRLEPQSRGLKLAARGFFAFAVIVAVVVGFVTRNLWIPCLFLSAAVLFTAIVASMARELDRIGPLIVCDSVARTCALPAHGLSFDHDQLIAWQVISGWRRTGLNLRHTCELNLLARSGEGFLCCHILGSGARELSGIAKELAEETGIPQRRDYAGNSTSKH
jgi:hypothetical protein